MKFLKDILSGAKALLTAPITNVLCVLGGIFVFASFAQYDKANGLSLHRIVSWPITALGLVLIILGVMVFLISQGKLKTHKLLDYQKGIEIKRGQLKIVIKKAEIQEIRDLTRNCAIVLPANTTFIDDCASDKRTAMGAFFGEHLPEEIAGLPKLFTELLRTAGEEPDSIGQYQPGTTIMLPERFLRPARVLITASTIRLPGSGIDSSPYIICKCIEEILRVTADSRIDSLYLPILGSGHGGVDRGLALLFLLLALLHFSRLYHHIRNVHIVVHPKDVDFLNESKELSQIIAL